MYQQTNGTLAEMSKNMQVVLLCLAFCGLNAANHESTRIANAPPSTQPLSSSPLSLVSATTSEQSAVFRNNDGVRSGCGSDESSGGYGGDTGGQYVTALNSASTTSLLNPYTRAYAPFSFDGSFQFNDTRHAQETGSFASGSHGGIDSPEWHFSEGILHSELGPCSAPSPLFSSFPLSPFDPDQHRATPSRIECFSSVMSPRL